jgi:hypothetical protein
MERLNGEKKSIETGFDKQNSNPVLISSYNPVSAILSEVYGEQKSKDLKDAFESSLKLLLMS